MKRHAKTGLCPLCGKPPTTFPRTEIPLWMGMARFAKYEAAQPPVFACRHCYNKESYILRSAALRAGGLRRFEAPCANPECGTTGGARRRITSLPLRFDSEVFHGGKVCLACHVRETGGDAGDDEPQMTDPAAIRAEAAAIRGESAPAVRPPRRFVRWEALPVSVMVRWFRRDPSRLIEPGIFLRERTA